MNGGPAMPGVSGGMQQACTLEARVCPDGTSVGRTGPNCAFALCPTTPGTSAGINGSANQGNMGGPASDQGVGDASKPGQSGADGAEGTIIGSNLALGTDANTKLGKYLISYNGMPLYTFANDHGTASTCYGTCAQNWPPYLVGAEDNVHNVKAGVDTIVRTNGTIQVTYNGHPLYFYAEDTSASGPTGNGVGGVWYVAKP